MKNLEFISELNALHNKVMHTLASINTVLTVPQLLTLNTLVQVYPVKMIDLSRRMQYTGANLTCIADGLERKGLVKRINSIEDRRVILLAPTEIGISKIEEIRVQINESLSLNASIEEMKDLFNETVEIE